MNRDELIEKSATTEVAVAMTVEYRMDSAHLGPSHDLFKALFRAGLREALPLIEADLRERLAQEIEAEIRPMWIVDENYPLHYGLRRAAVIVRGTPTTDTDNNGS